MRTLTLLSFFVLIGMGCAKQKAAPAFTFDLDGKSHLLLVNHTADSLDIRIRDKAIWPEKTHYDVSVLAPGSQRLEVRKTQGISDYYLSIEGQSYNLYTTPGSTDTVDIHAVGQGGRVKLLYAGNMAQVNQFLADKSSHFGSFHSDRSHRSAFMIDQDHTLPEVLAYNDSLTAANLGYLAESAQRLPKWYLAFEKKRFAYLNAWYKMNAIIYRTKTLNTPEPVDTELLMKPYHNLRLEDEEMLGNRDYMAFLYQYISVQIDFFDERKDQVQSSHREDIERRLQVIDQHFSGPVREAYLTSELCQYVDRGLLYDSAWLDRVKDEQFSSFLAGVESYYTDHH